jgi:hypothetical protein
MNTIRRSSLAVTLVISLLLLSGCASLDNNVYKAETAAAAVALASRNSYVVYWKSATNEPAAYGTTIEKLWTHRRQVEALSIQIGTSIELVDNLRLSYRTNSQVEAPLNAAVSTLLENTSNIVFTVTSLLKPQPITP